MELYKSRSESLEQDLVQKQNDHDRQRKMLDQSRVVLEEQVIIITESEN